MRGQASQSSHLYTLRARGRLTESPLPISTEIEAAQWETQGICVGGRAQARPYGFRRKFDGTHKRRIRAVNARRIDVYNAAINETSWSGFD